MADHEGGSASLTGDIDIPPDLKSRERILLAASLLFADRGYVATTTRDIATAVQMRQPSLFHHFKSKAAIAKVLIGYSMESVDMLVDLLTDQSLSPSVRLYSYVYLDTLQLAQSPYNLSGLNSNATLSLEEFADYRAAVQLIHAAQLAVIQEGLGSEEFYQMSPELAQELISGFIHLTLRRHFAMPIVAATGIASEIAEFALRAMMRSPRHLPEVRRLAASIVDSALFRAAK